MNESARIGILGVVAALAVAWFWLRSNESTTSPVLEADTRARVELAAEPIVAVSPTAAPAPAAEDNPAHPQAAPAPNETQRANTKKLTDAFERGVTPALVEYLVSKGASREDSERVVAEAMREMASCVQNATPAEEPAQSDSPSLMVGDPPIKLSGKFLVNGAETCITALYDRIGVPQAVTYEVIVQDGDFQFGAHLVAH